MRARLAGLVIAAMASVAQCGAEQADGRGGRPVIAATAFRDGEVTIDGRLDEWDASRAVSLRTSTAHCVDAAIEGDDDLSAQVMLGFDSSTLYVAAAVRDHHVEGRIGGRGIWQNDAIELWFDCRLDSVVDMSGEDDYQVVISYTTPSGDPGLEVYRNSRTMHLYAASRVATQLTADGYALEIALPRAGLLGLPRGERAACGFNVSVCDSDPGAFKRLLWSGTRIAYPEDFGLLTLGRIDSEAMTPLVEQRAQAEAPGEPMPEPPRPAPLLEVTGVNSQEVERFGRFEITARIRGDFANPYDFDDVCLRGHFIAPDGQTTAIDGFYMVPHRVHYLRGDESVTPSGEPRWQVRFTPMTVGRHRWRLELLVAGEAVAELAEREFLCVPSERHGFVRPARGAPHYLEHSDGHPYYAIGCGGHLWNANNACQVYDGYLNQLAAFGGNCLSVNLEVLGGGAFDLEVTGALGTYDQASAARFDYVIARAERRGIRLIPCLNQTAIAQAKHWEHSKYNARNGGPCEHAEEYFTSAEARRLQKRRLRYTVARWGYSPAILAWELFNEVNYTVGAQRDREAVIDWHREMSRYLHEIDPNGHMVTTSFGSASSVEMPQIWRLESIDATVTHEYGSDLALDLHLRNLEKWQYAKPCIGGETGLKFPAANRLVEIDPEGTGLHNSLWSSLVAGTAGNTLTWWMNRYLQPLDLFHHYQALASFVKDVPFTTAGFTPFEAPAYRSEAAAGWQDLSIPTFKAWGEASRREGELWLEETGLKRVVEVDGTGERPLLDTELPGVLYGRDHPEWACSPSMQVRVPHRMRLVFALAAVSTQGGRLEVLVDGERAALEAVKDRDGEDNPEARELDQRVVVVLEPGEAARTVTWRNVGAGWITIDEIAARDFLPASLVPEVRVWGLRGPELAIIWVHNCESIMEGGPPAEELTRYTDLAVPLTGLRPGAYEVEWWDTWRGRPTQRQRVRAQDGLVLRPPPFRRDVAAKVRR
ncbi:MAG: DUF5060 domain-containing protein [Armatimonadota bacterium]|nr:DUF5060 domain-containing protein [Armatimonadota bacterium]